MLEPYRLTGEDLALDCYPLESGYAKGAVVICPGGGYEMISAREGAPVAAAFNRAGYHAFVLSYDVAPVPLGYRPVRRLGRAVAYVRARAEELGVSPHSIGVCGFSAGGHLAAGLGVLWHREECFPGVPDLAAQKPDALILSYPVISAGHSAHESSFARLAGDDRAAWEEFSVEKLVDGRTPPSFLWHTAADPTVSAWNSLLFAEALLERGIPVELHLFPAGAHGLSLATHDVIDPERNRLADPHVARWFSLAVEWLECVFR